MRNRLFAPSAARTARRRKGLFAGRPWGRLWRVCCRPSGRNACASFFLCPFLPDLAAGRCSSPPEGSGVRCPRLPQKIVRAPLSGAGASLAPSFFLPCAFAPLFSCLHPAFPVLSLRFPRKKCPFSSLKIPLAPSQTPFSLVAKKKTPAPRLPSKSWAVRPEALNVQPKVWNVQTQARFAVVRRANGIIYRRLSVKA